MKHKTKKRLMATAVAAILVAGTLTAFSGNARATEQPADEKGECHGVNACKGQGACGGKGHSCAGKNDCKGKGWLKLTKAECDQKGGKFVAKGEKKES